jgi:Ni,Fe-hydrogenase maturation factor
MNKKDILELKRRLKKDYCTFSKVCGCYVNGEKNIILKFRENFLNLEEAEYHKYLDISNKVLSGTVGNNLLELNFPIGGENSNERQISLMQLKNSQLKDDDILDEFYQLVIDNYEYTGNFIILIYHDRYDVMTRTKDNIKLDESEETYEYVLCAICPVTLTDPGLSYSDSENRIKARHRDWVVDVPTSGFLFPAFIDRSSDVNSVIYYTKNAKDPHPEIMESVLGCPEKQTTAIIRDSFHAMVVDAFGADEEKGALVFMELQENLNAMVEEFDATYGDTDAEPTALTSKDMQNLLADSGVSEEIAEELEKAFSEYFEDGFPLAETLLDSKALKANEQRKKEGRLIKQVETLQVKLEEMKQMSEEPGKPEDALQTETAQDTPDSEYDIVLHVNPEKIPYIKSRVIDGQKCIVIPVNDEEQATVNGKTGLI